MAGIQDFLSVRASGSKINRSEEFKKTTVKKNDQVSNKTANTQERKDQARISDTARNMLNLRIDAKKYLDNIKQNKTLSESEIDKLKQKIDDNYFIDEEVVDKIVDKLIDLPNFLNTPFNT